MQEKDKLGSSGSKQEFELYMNRRRKKLDAHLAFTNAGQENINRSRIAGATGHQKTCTLQFLGSPLKIQYLRIIADPSLRVAFMEN